MGAWGCQSRPSLQRRDAAAPATDGVPAAIAGRPRRTAAGWGIARDPRVDNDPLRFHNTADLAGASPLGLEGGSSSRGDA